MPIACLDISYENFSQSPVSLILILCTTLVRTKLEYACSIWDPGHNTIIATLESVQNCAARFMLSNYHRTSSVTSMKNSLNLPTLMSHRRIFRLTLFHKIYHNNPFMRRELLTPCTYVSSRVDDQYKVGIPPELGRNDHSRTLRNKPTKKHST
uniref:Putative endonuclease/reverse transcript n=1 Tax=Ixodes ricinus TaxID=34613 RepID=A0A0K8R425_IXORI